jgi:hypothetical protein
VNESHLDFIETQVAETSFRFIRVAIAWPLVVALASAAGCDVRGSPPVVSNRA